MTSAVSSSEQSSSTSSLANGIEILFLERWFDQLLQQFVNGLYFEGVPASLGTHSLFQNLRRDFGSFAETWNLDVLREFHANLLVRGLGGGARHGDLNLDGRIGQARQFGFGSRVGHRQTSEEGTSDMRSKGVAGWCSQQEKKSKAELHGAVQEERESCFLWLLGGGGVLKRRPQFCLCTRTQPRLTSREKEMGLRGLMAGSRVIMWF